MPGQIGIRATMGNVTPHHNQPNALYGARDIYLTMHSTYSSHVGGKYEHRWSSFICRCPTPLNDFPGTGMSPAET